MAELFTPVPGSTKNEQDYSLAYAALTDQLLSILPAELASPELARQIIARSLGASEQAIKNSARSTYVPPARLPANITAGTKSLGDALKKPGALKDTTGSKNLVNSSFNVSPNSYKGYQSFEYGEQDGVLNGLTTQGIFSLPNNGAPVVTEQSLKDGTAAVPSEGGFLYGADGTDTPRPSVLSGFSGDKTLGENIANIPNFYKESILALGDRIGDVWEEAGNYGPTISDMLNEPVSALPGIFDKNSNATAKRVGNPEDPRYAQVDAAVNDGPVPAASNLTPAQPAITVPVIAAANDTPPMFDPAGYPTEFDPRNLEAFMDGGAPTTNNGGAWDDFLGVTSAIGGGFNAANSVIDPVQGVFNSFDLPSSPSITGDYTAYSPFGEANASMAEDLSGVNWDLNFADKASAGNEWWRQENLFGENGSFMPVSQGILGAGQLYMGLQGLDLAQDQFDFNKGVFDRNLKNQAQSYNTRLEDKHVARLGSAGSEASNYQSLDSYLNKNRLDGSSIG